MARSTQTEAQRAPEGWRPAAEAQPLCSRTVKRPQGEAVRTDGVASCSKHDPQAEECMIEVTKNQDKTMLIAGWALAVLMPIVGFFVGLAATIRGYAKHGIAMMVVSVLVTVAVSGLIVHEATKESDKQMAQVSAQLDEVAKDAQADIDSTSADVTDTTADETTSPDAGVDESATTEASLEDRIIKRDSLTSIAFAKNIVKAYDEQGPGAADVYSPVTDTTYTVKMREDSSTGDVTATGGNGIRVVFTTA
jgi:hypothetical protein